MDSEKPESHEFKEPPGPIVADDVKPPSPPSPPNGGSLAWLQVAGSFFLWFNTWGKSRRPSRAHRCMWVSGRLTPYRYTGFVNAFGVYQTYYELDLLRGFTASDISWIGSLQVFLLMVRRIAHL